MSGVSARTTLGAGFSICLQSRCIPDGWGLLSGGEQSHAFFGAPRTPAGAQWVLNWNPLNENVRGMRGALGIKLWKPFDLLTWFYWIMALRNWGSGKRLQTISLFLKSFIQLPFIFWTYPVKWSLEFNVGIIWFLVFTTVLHLSSHIQLLPSSMSLTFGGKSGFLEWSDWRWMFEMSLWEGSLNSCYLAYSLILQSLFGGKNQSLNYLHSGLLCQEKW